MAVSLSIKPLKSYLYVQASGTYDRHSVQESIDKTLHSATKHKLKKILIDLRSLEGEMSDMDHFSVAEYAASKRYKYEDTLAVRVALLGNESIINPNRLSQTVSRNRGLNLIETTNVDEACEWLDIPKENLP